MLAAATLSTNALQSGRPLPELMARALALAEHLEPPRLGRWPQLFRARHAIWGGQLDEARQRFEDDAPRPSRDGASSSNGPYRLGRPGAGRGRRREPRRRRRAHRRRVGRRARRRQPPGPGVARLPGRPGVRPPRPHHGRRTAGRRTAGVGRRPRPTAAAPDGPPRARRRRPGTRRGVGRSRRARRRPSASPIGSGTATPATSPSSPTPSRPTPSPVTDETCRSPRRASSTSRRPRSGCRGSTRRHAADAGWRLLAAGDRRRRRGARRGGDGVRHARVPPRRRRTQVLVGRALRRGGQRSAAAACARRRPRPVGRDARRRRGPSRQTPSAAGSRPAAPSAP